MRVARDNRAARRAVAVSLFLWMGLVSIATGSRASAQYGGDDLQECTRLLLTVPPEITVSPIVPYGHDVVPARGRAVAIALHGAESTPAVRLLEAAGATAFHRLSDGLTHYPHEWDRTFVVPIRPTLGGEEARALCASLEASLPGARAEPDALYPIPLDFRGAWARRSAPTVLDLLPRIDGDRPGERPGWYPDDPLFQSGAQWGLYNVGSGEASGVPGIDLRAPEAWLVTTGNTAVTLGVIDTGVDPDHPELAGLMPDGTPRFHAIEESFAGSGEPFDSVGHGTMVMGVLGALTNNGMTLDGGVAGVSGGSGGDSVGARLVSIKVTPGSATAAQASDIARGVTRAGALGADAVNLSFAFVNPNGILERALAFAGENGTLVISAAGNSADDSRRYPAAYSVAGLSASVAAIDASGNVPVWATRGEHVDVVAPGETIHSTWPTYANSAGSSLRNFAVTSGSSFSAPYVTGIAGLAKGLAPELKENDFREILLRTARDLGEPGEDDTYGAGLVDAAAIVEGLAAPRGIVHGRTAVQGWRFVAEETLTIERSGINRGGQGIDGRYFAEVWEVYARVDEIEGLAEPPQGWLRYSGEGGWTRGPVHEWNYSGGFVREGSETMRGFEVVSTVYFIRQSPEKCLECPPVGWVPRSPEQVIFEWTAWGRFARPPELAVLEPAPGALWRTGRQQTIRWSASDPDGIERVDLHLVGPDESGARLLATTGAGSDSLTTEVPCSASSGADRLRVTAVNVHGLSTVVEIPLETELTPCVPQPTRFSIASGNPSRGQVQFRYDVGESLGANGELMQIRIHDVRGRVVATLRDEIAEPSSGSVIWDGRFDAGRVAPAGIYFAVFSAGSERRTERFVFLR